MSLFNPPRSEAVQASMDSSLQSMIENGYSDLDKDYFSNIEKYKDSQYYDLLKNNPYLLSKNPFEENLWQKLGGAFGDDSAYTNYLNQLRQQRDDYMSRVVEGIIKQDYESEVSQVGRLRSAGINPDLDGGSGIVPGKTGVDQPDMAGSVVNDYQSSIQSIAQAGVSFIGTAFSLVSGLQSMRSAFLDNEAKQLLMSENFQSNAWNILGDSVAGYLQANPKYTSLDSSDPSFVEIMPSVIQSFADRVNKLPYTHRQKSKLRNTIDNLAYTYDERGNKVASAKFETLWNNTLAERNKSRNNLASSSGLIGADTETTEALKFIGEKVYKPLNKLQLDLTSQQLKFDRSYLSKANELEVPSLQADSEAVQLMFQRDMNNMRVRITSTFEDINRKIIGNKKLSENWKMALQVGSSVAESLIITNMSNMPHLNIGIRNGVHDTRDTFVHGVQ